jgi:hypothetical protein
MFHDPSVRRGKQPRVPRALRSTLISAGVLLVLIVSAGAAYTWYVDGRPLVKPQLAASSFQQTSPLPPAVKPAANARVGASVETLTTPVPPGSNASITVRTLATATCKISVVYNNVASTDSGLNQQVADEYGTVNWTWTVGPSVPLGTWPVNVTCAYNGRSGFVRGDLQVAKQGDAPS